MFAKGIVLILTVFSSLCLVVSADVLVAQTLSKTSMSQIEKVTVNIPLLVDEASQNKIIKALNAMAGKRFVYLDFSIIFALGESGKLPYTVNVDGKPHVSSVKNCDFGALMMGEGVRYSMGPIVGYNHLLISVLTGGRSSFPFNDVSCEYTARVDQARFHIRGFFYVLSRDIPTATELDLRPLSPPFEVAREVLSRKR